MTRRTLPSSAPMPGTRVIDQIGAMAASMAAQLRADRELSEEIIDTIEGGGAASEEEPMVNRRIRRGSVQPLVAEGARPDVRPMRPTPNVPRSSPRPEVKPIFWWKQSSSRGIGVHYTVLLHSNGDLTCDCPGWVYHTRRTCKHTESRQAQARELLNTYRTGGTLPELMAGQECVGGPVEDDGQDEVVVTAVVRPRPQPQQPAAPETGAPTFNRKIEV